MWSPPDPGIGVVGDQLMLQAGGRGEIWKVDGCLLVLESTQLMGARPHKWVRALILGEHPK